LIYGCIVAVLIVALGIALILSCLDIYNSGPRPYTPESIGLRFSRIAILVYSCLTLVVGGILLDLILPAREKKPKVIKDELALMEKAKAKSLILDTENIEAIKKEQKYRLILRVGTTVIFAVLMIYPAIYFMDGSHFTIETLNHDIRNAVCITLIPAVIGLLLCYICSELERKSISRETDVYKKAAMDAKGTTSPSVPANSPKKFNAIIITRCVLLGVAICFIVIGIFNGGMKDVLDKAIAICTECIGLG
jgi:hypothetical protein